MRKSEQLGENIIHDQKMEGGSSKKEQPAGIRRGGKIQKLTVVDIGKQYSDSLKEIGKELRRSWVRIPVTILTELYPTYGKKRKVNWIGYILRGNCLLRHVIEGKIERMEG